MGRRVPASARRSQPNANHVRTKKGRYWQTPAASRAALQTSYQTIIERTANRKRATPTRDRALKISKTAESVGVAEPDVAPRNTNADGEPGDDVDQEGDQNQEEDRGCRLRNDDEFDQRCDEDQHRQTVIDQRGR